MRSIREIWPARTLSLSLMLVAMFITTLAAQSGRPKILVLRPQAGEDIRDETVEDFQWDLAKQLDKSGKFDIVERDDYEEFLEKMDLDEADPVPDSLVPMMMDSLQAVAYTDGKLTQGGEDGPLSATVHYIFPRNDYRVEGGEFTVEERKKTEDLAKMTIKPIVDASERISAMSIARSYFNSAIYDKAIQNYEKLLQFDPDDSDIHYMIGLSLLKSEDKAGAVAKFQQILNEVDPDHIATREVLASTYYADKQYDKALEHYKVLTDMKPDNYEYQQYLAFSYYQVGQMDESFDAFKRLVEIRDDSENIRMQMANIAYRKAIQLEEAGDTAAAQQSYVAASENFGRAVELCGEAEETNDQMMCQCLNFQAVSLNKAGQSNQALEVFQKLAEIDPTYSNVYLQMTYIAYKNDDHRQVVDYGQKAVEYVADEQKSSIYQMMGRSYEDLGQLSSAIDAYTKGIRFAADASRKNTLLFQRGLVYYELGNQLDYAADENADMDALIEEGTMTLERANRAETMYQNAEPDLAKVTGRYAKSAKAHIDNIVQLRERLTKIKQQIDYYEKTK